MQATAHEDDPRVAHWVAGAAAGALLAACGGGEEQARADALAERMREPAGAVSGADSAVRISPLAAARLVDATAFFDWAETAYPQYFPSHPGDRVSGALTYRVWPETGNALGVLEGQVYLLGPLSGGTLMRLGTLGDFGCRINNDCASAPTLPQAARFLAQASLGADKAQIQAVATSDYATWIEAQFAAPRSPGHCDWLAANGFGADANRDNSNGLDNTIWRKFIESPDPLRQRMVLALSELLVVSVNGVNGPWRQFAVGAYLDILEDNAFGNWRTLLGQVATNAAMGSFLTFRGNRKASTSGSQPDENFARELMQLFTIGLLQLRPDGTPTAAETYTASDVSQLARVFTGWDLDTSGFTSPYPSDVVRRPMTQIDSRYETGSKTFLGTTIAAGTPARAALDAALDTLFNHPHTPPFVGRQLIQRLVASNPSPAYVGRVAAAFANNGQGVRGDMKAVIRAILLDPEARDAGATQGKLREPVVRFLNWARGFGATSPGGQWAIGNLSDAGTRLGQSPMRAASVFNFFRPGYVSATGLAAPELQITNETSVAGYVNFMQRAVAGSGIGDVRANYASLLPLAADSAALLGEINLVLAAGQLSGTTLATLKTALDTISAATDAGKSNRVYAALTLVLAAPEYIVQK
jgi:uncharacterized protein (DUF1800 family)